MTARRERKAAFVTGVGRELGTTSGFLDRVGGAARASTVRASSAQDITHCERDEGECARGRGTPPSARFDDRQGTTIVFLSNHHLLFAGGEPGPAGTEALR